MTDTTTDTTTTPGNSTSTALDTGTGTVTAELRGRVAVVTVNAPQRRNALTPAMATELIATFDEVERLVRRLEKRVSYERT